MMNVVIANGFMLFYRGSQPQLKEQGMLLHVSLYASFIPLWQCYNKPVKNIVLPF
jgi:hypothetical protein